MVSICHLLIESKKCLNSHGFKYSKCNGQFIPHLINYVSYAITLLPASHRKCNYIFSSSNLMWRECE